jgi:DNA-binding NarL/FixJ family response regulator
MIRLLLVDDQAIVRTGLRTLLEVEPDLEIVGEAAHGRAAVRAVTDLAPDVVLMDIRMPDMDGIAATEAIIRAGSLTRVCILTTYNVDEYVFDALAAGASGFLLKTDTPERIVATVRAVAEGEFALGAEATATLVARYVQGARPSTGGQDPLAALTPRERDVFLLVARGLTNAEIGDALVVGEGTVKTHVARIFHKLGLRDRLQVVVFAHSRGLLGIPASGTHAPHRTGRGSSVGHPDEA